MARKWFGGPFSLANLDPRTKASSKKYPQTIKQCSATNLGNTVDLFSALLDPFGTVFWRFPDGSEVDDASPKGTCKTTAQQRSEKGPKGFTESQTRAPFQGACAERERERELQAPPTVKLWTAQGRCYRGPAHAPRARWYRQVLDPKSPPNTVKTRAGVNSPWSGKVFDHWSGAFSVQAWPSEKGRTMPQRGPLKKCSSARLLAK